MKQAFSSIVAAFALVASPLTAAVPASQPVLSVAQQTALHCSAVFGVAAGLQQRHVRGSEHWPQLETGGKAFFVQTLARLMDETGASRDQIAALVQADGHRVASAIVADRDPIAATTAALAPCLPLLNPR